MAVPGFGHLHVYTADVLGRKWLSLASLGRKWLSLASRSLASLASPSATCENNRVVPYAAEKHHKYLIFKETIFAVTKMG